MLKRAIPLGALLAFGAATPVSPAAGQSLGQAIQNRLDSTATLLGQQGHSDRVPAATGPVRGKVETAKGVKQVYSSRRSSSATATPFSVPADHDSFRRIKATTYKLGNGVLLQVTGVFRPDAATVCIAYCS